jgi:hypothetical protein
LRNLRAGSVVRSPIQIPQTFVCEEHAEHNQGMSRALAITLLVLLLPAWITMERGLEALTHRQRRPMPRDKRPRPQDAVKLAGYAALGALIWPLRQQLGWLWAANILGLAIGLWSAIVGVVFFGVPDRAGPGKPVA